MGRSKFNIELDTAAMLGDIPKLSAILKSGEDPNQVGPYGSILARATWYNNVEAVRLLLDCGAKPNLNKGDALFCSVSSPNQPKNAGEVVRLLAAKGADLNRVYKVQSEIPLATPLMIAIFFGYGKTAEVLLELGADVHYCNDEGQSAFSLAVDANMQKIGQRLLDHGFKPDLKNKYLKKFVQKLKMPEEKTDNYISERYYLMPLARGSSSHSTGEVKLESILAEKLLPLCPNPPVHLLTLDLKKIAAFPEKIRRIGKLHVPFYYCSDCNGEPDALDFQIGKTGKLKLLSAIKGKQHKCSSDAAGGPPKKFFLKAVSKKPASRCGIFVGGEPGWWQYPAWPHCPHCGLNGFFIGQISQAIVPPGHGGPDNAIYVFVCADCRTEMLVRQMT